MIKNRKADKIFLTYVPHEYMGDTQGKMSDSQGGLEFRPQYQLNRSVMSNSWPPHGLQHAKLLWSSPTPGACSDSCPLSWWCHPTISSSVIPFSSCLQSFLASGSFQRSQFFTSGSQGIGLSASASVLPMNIQDWFQILDTWKWRRHVLCPQCHCQGVDDPSWCFSHINYGSKLRVWTWTKSDGAV